MPLVLDASVALAWCFEDEKSEYADRVLDTLARDRAAVPAVWPLEVANALYVGERRGRTDAPAIVRQTALLTALPISVESIDLERALGSVLNLARQHGLSCYDASYLELAMREGLPLATADELLAKAAQSAGVRLVS